MTVSLCGDVMLGRGVDQILPHPGDPTLHERGIRDARGYVRLAEAVNGPIPRPVDFGWPWGDSLRVLDESGPGVRVVNLETTITERGRFAPGKQVHYRMSPANVGCLTAARPDVCVLANNHVLDFGQAGLADTLEALSGAGLRAAGAGRTAAEARRPATVPVEGGGRVVVFAFGTASSGVPRDWAATGQRPGVAFLPSLSSAIAGDISGLAQQVRQPGDLVVVSLHWGSNWGYDVPDEQIRFRSCAAT